MKGEGLKLLNQRVFKVGQLKVEKSENIMKVKVAQLCLTVWDPMDMTFFRPEYWNGLTIPSPGDVPDPGIKPGSPTISGEFFS